MKPRRRIRGAIGSYWLVLGIASACGGKLSADQVARLERDTADQNAQALTDARAQALRDYRLIARPEREVSLDRPIIHERVAAARLGLVAGEELVRIAETANATPRLALLVPSCRQGQSCYCFEPTSHMIAVDPDGHETIVRLRAVETVRAVHQKGSCGYGCGQPSPPSPPYVYWLDQPVTSLRLVEVSYPRRSLDVSCDKMIPRP